MGGAWRLSEDLLGRPLMLGLRRDDGFLSSLMGIGGGALAMTLHGRTIHVAILTSAAVGLPPDAVGFVSLLAVAIPLSASLAST